MLRRFQAIYPIHFAGKSAIQSGYTDRLETRTQFVDNATVSARVAAAISRSRRRVARATHTA